jgi:hypothetical protein
MGFVWGRRARLALWLSLALGLGWAVASRAADRLVWRDKEGLVDADLEGWPLAKLLVTISAKTHWQILVEPKLEHAVTAKFSGLKTGEALRRLLGGLNFMLVPATNGPSKLLVFQTSMQAATDLVAAPPEPELPGADRKAIPNELIVTLKRGAKQSIEQIAERLGAKIVGRAADLRAYRLEFEGDTAAQTARAQLANDEDVESVEANYAVAKPSPPEPLALGVLPPFTLRPKATTDTSRVVVGLIDTAVQTQGTVLKDFLLPAVSVAAKAEPPTDQPTHGTAMAETVLYALSRSSETAGGTPVRLLPVDVYGNGGSTTTFEIAKGIYAAINGGARVVNLSLGGDSDSPLVHEVIKSGHDQGVVFVGAAGNEPVTTPTYPAAYPEVIAATASTRDGQIAPYANRGDFVDVAAPGASLVPYQNEPYLIVGTSTATANVSAAAALVLSATGKGGSELEAQLRKAFAVKPAPGPR